MPRLISLRSGKIFVEDGPRQGLAEQGVVEKEVITIQVVSITPNTVYDGLTGVVVETSGITTSTAEVWLNGIKQNVTGTTANTITFNVECSGTTMGNVNLEVRAIL